MGYFALNHQINSGHEQEENVVQTIAGRHREVKYSLPPTGYRKFTLLKISIDAQIPMLPVQFLCRRLIPPHLFSFVLKNLKLGYHG